MNAAQSETHSSSLFSSPKATYIHVPFCSHRCGYCNFTLVANRDDLIDRYLSAIEKEIETSITEPQPMQTLFLGGGTPTHLSISQLERLLIVLQKWFPLRENAEFSIEANPIDISREKVALFDSYGVNRISLGVQSFADHVLKTLERDHRQQEIDFAVKTSKQLMRSTSIDLIFAVPGQSMEDWKKGLQQAIELAPEHISTYGLTFELGTRFWARREQQDLEELNEDLQCEMYEYGIEQLQQSGYEHYEVSNFAQADFRCQHNFAYWNGESYYAFGPGAARYVNGVRETNHRSTTTYLKRIENGESPVAGSETLSPEDRAREAAVLALRTIDGVHREIFKKRTGFDLDSLLGQPLKQFTEQGFFTDDLSSVKLSRKGLLVSDALWGEFLKV